MMRRAIAALILSSAGPALAEDFLLAFPVDCTLGDDCYIQQYMDRDPGAGVTDYRCHNLAYDGHKGTDFALPTRADMNAGVDVLAAADGVVRGFRDGMPDTGWSEETADAIEGRECGNGMVLTHPGGWETQYCHLRKGTVTVHNGQKITAGDVLGQIGMSGRSEFPHLHMSVRKDGERVDPFDAKGGLTCGAEDNVSLWIETPPYQPGGLISAGLTDQVPDFDAVKAGLASSEVLLPDAPAMVVFGFSFGTRKGDVIRMHITGPEGEVARQDTTMERDRAQAFRAIGKRRRGSARWAEGLYTGTATLLRDGIVISERSTALIVRAP